MERTTIILREVATSATPEALMALFCEKNGCKAPLSVHAEPPEGTWFVQMKVGTRAAAAARAPL